MIRPLLLAILALGPAAAADPALDTAGWIQAAAAGRIADQVARLPEARRAALAVAWSDGATAERGPRRGGWDMPVRGLTGMPPDEAANLLLTVLREAGDPSAAVTPAAAGRDPRQGFAARMAGRMLSGGLPRSILATGLETRQTAVLAALAEGHRVWTQAEGADPARPAAMVPALTAMTGALALDDQGLVGLPMTTALARIDAAIPHLLDALTAAGLDARATLGGAQVREESRSGTRAVVVVTFTAFAARHELPLAVVESEGTWTPVADSPLLRWLNPPRPAWAGRGRGGDGRAPQGGPGERPEDAPRPGAGGGAPF